MVFLLAKRNVLFLFTKSLGAGVKQVSSQLYSTENATENVKA